jgi:hypothetical protein
VGGRLATRSASDASLRSGWLAEEHRQAGFAFDHAAQYFTASDKRFAALVAGWEALGAVRRWDGPVGELRGGVFTADAGSQQRCGGWQAPGRCCALPGACALRVVVVVVVVWRGGGGERGACRAGRQGGEEARGLCCHARANGVRAYGGSRASKRAGGSPSLPAQQDPLVWQQCAARCGL